MNKNYKTKERSKMQKFLTKSIEKKLIENFRKNENQEKVIDFKPVVKFFGGGACTWLFTEYDPEEKMFFGLCDLGMGYPELGYVSRDEIEKIRFKPFNMPVERDIYTTFDKTLSEYAEEARSSGRIEV